MASKKYRVYEVQVPGQITRLVACEDMQETEDELIFTADGITVFKVGKDDQRWWQLTPRTARKPGVTRTRGLSRAYSVFELGRRIGNRE